MSNSETPHHRDLPPATPRPTERPDPAGAPVGDRPRLRVAAEEPIETVVARFERQVRERPQAVAAELDGAVLRYGELDRQANRLAHWLRARGVGPNVPVGLCLDRSFDLLVGVLGILKAGGAYLPLDPSYPEERLSYMLEHAAAPWVVCHARHESVLAGAGASLFRLDAQRDDLQGLPEHAESSPSVQDLCYVVYTSGSTGQPKAIAMAHRPLANLVRWQLQTSRAGRGRTLQFTPISFDVSFQEIFATLGAGGRLTLIAERTRRNPQALLEVLVESEIERMFLPFAALQALADVGAASDLVPRALTEVITAGEQLRITESLAAWFEQMPGCSLVNHYGPAESHVVTSHELSGPPSSWALLPPIGRPLPHAEVHLLNEERTPVRNGEVGEIFLGGDCLAAGYLGQPELTERQFVPRPPGLEGWGPLYRTGDLARRDERGDLHFLGRTDHQLKIRGHRIEPGEVEAGLELHPGVSQAVVAARSERTGLDELVAYLVPAHGEAPSPSQLREHLRRRLPEYMLPSLFLTVHELPLTPSGKVDRQALPAPATSNRSADNAPDGGLKGAVATLWCELLGVEEASDDDNFFDLGGHSLLVAKLLARLDEELGCELSFDTLFETPTFGDLVRAAQQATAAMPPGSDDREVREPGLPRIPRRGHLSMSRAQQRLWHWTRSAPPNAAYNLPYAFRLRGPVDAQAMQSALQALVMRHESLRASFPEAGGRPHQRVHADLPARLHQLDLSTVAAEDRDEQLQAHLAAVASRPFDLTSPPLFRAGLVRMQDDDHVLYVVVHHMVSDGSSMAILFRDLSDLLADGPVSATPATQFVDYVAWSQAGVDPETTRRSESWWRRHLQGAPELHQLPTSRPRPAVFSYRGSSLDLTLEPELRAAIRALGARHGATGTAVLLAAWASLVHRLSGAEDVVVAVPISGRDHPSAESTVGFFVNTLPLRIRFTDRPQFQDVLRQVKETLLEVRAHAALPFDELVRALAVPRSSSHNPIVQLAFVHLPPGERDLQVPDVDVAHVPVDRGACIFDLTLFYSETPDGLDFRLEYSSDLFDRADAETLLERLHALLRASLDDATTPVARLPVWRPGEQDEVLAHSHGPAVELDLDRCFHHLFAEQADRTPDAVAVRGADGRSLTYGELRRRANQLAHHLRSEGVQPDTIVALCLDRSPDLIVAILAVLTAGGAYLPVDPTLPRKRIAFMLRDAGCGVVLTQTHLGPRLPRLDVPVLELDSGALGLDRWPDDAPECDVQPSHLAYVIYTSGSTGRPKAAMIEHRSLVNLCETIRPHLGIAQGDRVMQFAALSFDVSVAEWSTALTAGATLCLLPPGRPLVGRDLGRFLKDQAIDIAFLPPSVVPDIPQELATTVRTLVVAGEACPKELVDRWATDRRVVNAYGPTECTVYATCADCVPGEATPPIGRPLPNVSAYVLDDDLRPMPVGVAGHLHLGGQGVGRGYLGRPELTDERFVADPFSNEPDARMYDTGDLARFRPDGQLEYLGRRDHQVKIRGFRIETGEIEHALRSQPEVRAAAVLPHSDGGPTSLVAYVQPADDAVDPTIRNAASDDRISEWTAVYDGIYAAASAGSDDGAAFAGWTSSLTGKPLALEDMRLWRDTTLAHILGLHPRRVLELGCGTGLLAFPLAEQCDEVVGTDLSARVVDLITEEATRRGLSTLRAEHREASDLSGLPKGHFDVVVLNSVIQYFPSDTYLHEVLDGALAMLAPGGALFLGDLRSLPLAHAFHATIQAHHAPDEMPSGAFRAAVQQGVQGDKELLLDPAFFRRWSDRTGDVADVEVLVKRGASGNEVETFRYDVLIRRRAAAPVQVSQSRTFRPERDDVQGLRQWLRVSAGDQEILGVPDERLRVPLALWEESSSKGTVAEVKARAQSTPAGLPPESLWALGDELGCHVRITPSRSRGPGFIDVLFEREARASHRPWHPGGDERIPGSGARLHNTPTSEGEHQALAAQLQRRLAEELPDYMVPSRFLVLDELPLTPSGKLDRSALPRPKHRERPRRADSVTPRDWVERAIAAVWSQLLEIEDIGVHDDFFELGGHSLLIARVVYRLKEEHDIDLPSRAMYESPTVAQLARIARQAQDADDVEGICYDPELDLNVEAALDEAIRPDAPPVDTSRPAREVFLTGGTGFVGGYLLAELLNETEADITCLVRARDVAHGRQRLRQNLVEHAIPESVFDRRVQVVVGDLTKPRLGLDEWTFDRLGERMDVVYHNGAKVDHVRGYHDMKPANVFGTQEAFRLTCHRRLKPFHFISTLGAIDPRVHLQAGEIDETTPVGPLHTLANGYMQSKCVSEQMANVARERGIPTTIYRLGAVTGDSRNGYCDPTDWTYSGLRSVIEIGMADNLNPDMSIVPVNFVAEAIVALATAPGTTGRIFNVTNSKPAFWLDLMQGVIQSGYTIEFVHFPTLVDRLREEVRAGAATPILAFLPFVSQLEPGTDRYVLQDFFCHVAYNADATMEALAPLGVDKPLTPGQLLPVYLAHLEQSGLLRPSVPKQRSTYVPPTGA